MLRVCEKLRAVDAKSWRLGLVRTETDYLRALLYAMANMDRLVEVEVLKSLGDVNLEKGRLEKNPDKLDRAMVLYKTALIRCEDTDVVESLDYRYHYAEKLRLGKEPTTSSYEPLSTSDKKMSSFAEVAEKFLKLDQRLIGDSLQIEYTKLMAEGIVNDDNMLETEAIKSLGDVFLKRGTETRDTTCLTKATALYNTALARYGETLSRETLIHRLMYTARIRQDMEKTRKKSAAGEAETKAPQLATVVQKLQKLQKLLKQATSIVEEVEIKLANTEGEAKERVIDSGAASMSDSEVGSRFPGAAATSSMPTSRMTLTENHPVPKMLRVCEKLRAVDAKSKRLGLVRTETDYLRALLDAMADMDRCVEVEVLKSLGDVNLDKGRPDKSPEKFYRAMILYRTALIRCGDADVGKSLDYRYHFAEKLRLGKQATASSSYEPLTNDKKMTSLAEVAETFLRLDQRLTVGGNKNSLLIEYTKLMVEGIVNDDNMLETEAIKGLGDVFLKRGTETRDPTCLTKATALYNTALARCGRFQGTVALIHRLLYTARVRQDMKKTRKKDPEYRGKRQKEVPIKPLNSDVNDDARGQQSMSYEEHLTKGDRAQADGNLDEAEQNFSSALKLIHGTSPYSMLLEEMRSRYKSQLENIDQQHDPYQYDEDDPMMIPAEAKRAEAVKDLFKNIAEDRRSFIEGLVGECIGTLGPPPCKYAFIGLGSQATELVTPYSDLEFAILIEDGKDNDVTRRYFLNLTHYLHLKVINLGETILPPMAIPSLNDFPEKDWFFDSVTPRGFAFDGFMPWASKTPFGRDQTENKPPVSLIQTPVEMAKFQELEVSVAEGYHLSDILRRAVFLTGEESLVDEYRGKLKEIITGDLLSFFQSRLSALLILRENSEHLSTFEPTGQLLNVKKDIYRFPAIAIEVLALFCQITLASTWNVIDELKEMGKIHEENAIHLMVLTSISAELRLRTYMTNALGDFLGDITTGISSYEDSLRMFKSIHGDTTAHPNIAASLNNLGSSWSKVGDCKKAISYYEQSLWMMKTIYGHNTAHPDIAASLNNLGSSWSKLGDYEKANSYYEQSLWMMKTIYGHNTAHPDIAASLNNLGSSWSKLGDYKKAISYYEQSLLMEKTVYGHNTPHPDIAASLNNLGSSWDDLGDYEKAISYYEQSLSMKQTIYGHNTAHPDIAASLNNVGSSWSKLGDYKKAISYYEQSLSITKTIYGANTAHPDIAASLNNLGSSLTQLGDYKKAISYYEQSLSMVKTIYGANTAHPDIASSLNNLGSSWTQLGDYKKAISYYEQSLSMVKTIYGHNTCTAHPNISALLNNLGSSWSKLGDYKKAISYHEQSLSMKKTIYGHNTTHPDIAASLNNLGSSWSKLGDYKKAISYYEQSLSMNQTIYEDNTPHPDIAASLNNLGSSWSELGDYEKAISYYEQSLSMNQTIYGENTEHPVIAASLYNLGLSWSELGESKKAISYFEQSLLMEKTVYGDNTAHPDIAASLNNLGSSWDDLGDCKKAIGYHEQSLWMTKAIYGHNTPHLDIAASLNNLGSSWSNLGDCKKAIGYFEQSLSMLKAIYGDNAPHPYISTALHNLHLAWTIIGNHKRAMEYKQQLQRMQKVLGT
ncbi:TTC28 [Branchiostoma lanceolatum]|uniref:TTC28 protein n=1 Tax=Branchiostoma lanceolatum TaxID=7740 RepID=A0A8J9W1X8_BRALA|nr:TTC28 [Branchiostoma lanceolatum]